MQYFNILNCSGNITSCCTSPGIASIMTVLRRIYSFIQIIVPIILIVAIILHLVNMLSNPDDKKNNSKKIFNSIIATMLIYFLPTILTVILNVLPEQIQLTACWESAADVDRVTRASAYISLTEEERQSIIIGSGDYEKGIPKPKSEEGSIEGAQYLEGGMPIPLYYQQDYKDVLLKAPDRTVSTSGCGFTSCAMIVSYLLDEKITPREFVGDWSRKHYYNGMAWSLPQATVEHYNLADVRQTTSINEVVQALQDNHPVMSSQRAGLFTSGGHLIVLRGVTSDGKILVNDPNRGNAVGKGYNNRAFTPSEINAGNKMYFIYPKKEEK